MPEGKTRVVFEEKIECPHCGKGVKIIKTRTLVTPAEPAEYNEAIEITKNVQKKLSDKK